MEQLGAPKEIIESLTQSQVVKILPMNWPIVVWFTEVSELLRWRSDGQCLGLDLTQIKSDNEILHRDFTAEQYKGLKIMGKTAARTINKVDA